VTVKHGAEKCILAKILRKLKPKRAEDKPEKKQVQEGKMASKSFLNMIDPKASGEKKKGSTCPTG